MIQENENRQFKEKGLARQLNYSFDFQRLLGSFLANWYWFLLSIAVGVSAAWAYLRYTTPQYSIQSSLLLDDASDGVTSSVLDKINIDKSVSGPSIYNEISLLSSQDLIRAVVDSLDLNVRYSVKGKVKQTELYEEKPIKIEFENPGYTGFNTQLEIRQIVDGQFEITEQVNGGAKQIFRLPFDAWSNRSYGRFKIIYQNNKETIKGYLKLPITITLEPVNIATSRFQGTFKAATGDGRTSMLALSLIDTKPLRGIDFLNMLIRLYHRNELLNITLFAKKTKEFILQRQQELVAQLQSVDRKVADMQAAAGMADPVSQTQAYMQQLSTAQQNTSELMMRRASIMQLRVQIAAITNRQMVSGIISDDPTLSALITDYNSSVRALEPLLTEPEDNMRRRNAESAVASTRKRIIDAADQVLASINSNINTYSQTANAASGRMSMLPTLERNVTDAKRGYDVQQNMFLLLYQKYIETEISEYAATNRSKVVVVPYASGGPISPISRTAYLLGFALGLLLPLSLLSARELLNNKVSNEKDIQMLTEVPLIGSVSKAKDGTGIVVGENIRTGIAEQFRLIRANLEFMSLTDKKKVMMITSSVSGEGKTFASINLGLTLALASKRVLVMEFDMRKPKITERLNLSREGGISAYLAGMAGLDKVIKPSGLHDNLHIANCGAIPPNPGELLLLPRCRQMIEDLQEIFDIIILDTAPLGLVSDALILSQYAGTNLFIVRQAHTVKDHVRMLDSIHRDGKIHNMALIFNGVENSKRYGYGSGYGYGYGYGYGHGYGSGYYEDDKPVKKSMMERLFKSGSKN